MTDSSSTLVQFGLATNALEKRLRELCPYDNTDYFFPLYPAIPDIATINVKVNADKSVGIIITTPNTKDSSRHPLPNLSYSLVIQPDTQAYDVRASHIDEAGTSPPLARLFFEKIFGDRTEIQQPDYVSISVEKALQHNERQMHELMNKFLYAVCADFIERLYNKGVIHCRGKEIHFNAGQYSQNLASSAYTMLEQINFISTPNTSMEDVPIFSCENERTAEGTYGVLKTISIEMAKSRFTERTLRETPLHACSTPGRSQYTSPKTGSSQSETTNACKKPDSDQAKKEETESEKLLRLYSERLHEERWFPEETIDCNPRLVRTAASRMIHEIDTRDRIYLAYDADLTP